MKNVPFVGWLADQQVWQSGLFFSDIVNGSAGVVAKLLQRFGCIFNFSKPIFRVV
jgi:hypothetical protein